MNNKEKENKHFKDFKDFIFEYDTDISEFSYELLKHIDILNFKNIVEYVFKEYAKEVFSNMTYSDKNKIAENPGNGRYGIIIFYEYFSYERLADMFIKQFGMDKKYMEEYKYVLLQIIEKTSGRDVLFGVYKYVFNMIVI